MSKRMLSTICAIFLCGGTTVSVAQEKAPGPIKIGVIADMSGIYQGNSGKGATVAVQLAVEDVGGFETSFRGTYEDQAFLVTIFLKHADPNATVGESRFVHDP